MSTEPISAVVGATTKDPERQTPASQQSQQSQPQMFTIHITNFSGYFWLQPQSSAAADSADSKQTKPAASQAAATGSGSGGGGGIFAALGLARPPKNKPPPEEPIKPDPRGQAMRDVLKKCYDAVLKDDPNFHYFFEPEIIIRVSNVKIANALSQFLSTGFTPPLEHTGYRYPTPQPLIAAYTTTSKKSTKSKAGGGKGGNSSGSGGGDTKTTFEVKAVVVEEDEEERECKRLGLICATATTTAATTTATSNASAAVPAPPPPPPRTIKHRYCEDPSGIVIRQLPIFLPIFHAHSVAAITLSASEHVNYMERTVHTMYNPAMYSRQNEGKACLKLGAWKMGVVKAIGWLEANAATMYDEVS